MSRIRSQLEEIRRNTAQKGPYREAHEPAPRPVAHPVGSVRDEAKNPASQAHGAEMGRIRQQLDQLTGVIGTLARSQQQKAQDTQHAAMHARQPAPTSQPPAEDRNSAAALARIELLQREMADVKHMLTQIASQGAGQELADVRHMLTQMSARDAGEDLDDVKRMLAQMTARDTGEDIAAELRRVAEGIARLQDDKAAQFDPVPHLDEVASELNQIREAVIALADERQNFDPGMLARSIEDGYARIAGQLDTALQRDTGRDDKEELSLIAGQLGQLRDLVENLPRQMPVDSLSARLEEIAESVIRMDNDKTLSSNFQAMEERLDEITRALVTISVNPVTSGAGEGLERIEARLASLSRNIEELAARNEAAPADGGYSSPVLDHIMMQLGDLSGRLETSLPANGIDPAQWVDPVLARLEEMGSRMDALGAASAESKDSRLRSIEDQIAAIASFIEQSAEPQEQFQPVPDDRLAALEDALGAISSRLQSVSTDGVDFSPIAGRLDLIEEHFAAARDMAMEAATQAAQRAVEMAGNSPSEPMSGETVLDMLAERLEGIEQQLAISRDMAMDAAAQAAERAFQLAGQMQPAPVEDTAERDAQLVDHFSRELANLDAQARELASRSDDSFETIRQALQSISQRLEGIEDDIRRATAEPYEAPPLAHEPYEMREPAPVYRAPSLATVREFEPQPTPMFDEQPVGDMETPSVEPFNPEPEIEDIPLEPGSGIPDLAALVRDASKRRRASSEGSEDGDGNAQDFLAAARRAAQAAAQETAPAPAAAEKSPSRLSRFTLPALLKGRSKLLIGASAAVLLLAAALPIASQFAGSGAPAGSEIEAQAVAQEPAELQAQGEAGGRAVRDDNAQIGAQIEASAAGTADTPLVQPVDPLEAAQETPVENAPADIEADATVAVPELPEGIGNSILRQAVEDGDPGAFFEIARRYTDGDGVERNLEIAALWYEVGRARRTQRRRNIAWRTSSKRATA